MYSIGRKPSLNESPEYGVGEEYKKVNLSLGRNVHKSMCFQSGEIEIKTECTSKGMIFEFLLFNLSLGRSENTIGTDLSVPNQKIMHLKFV